MNEYVPLIILIITNLLFISNHHRISLLINIYDIPDNNRKLHKNKTPILGGILVLINFLIISLFYFTNLQNIIFLDEYYTNFRSFLIFVFAAISFFLIGIYDDKYTISSTNRLFISIFLLLIILKVDNSIIISEINLSFLNQVIYLESFSLFFTILCFLLFINAFNMYDGINLQSAIYSLIMLSYVFINNNFDYFTLLFSVPIFFYFFLNLSGKSFLGDGGAYIISFILSYIIVKNYNIDNFFFADEIFIIMFLPGIELLRLALFRLSKGRHPFSPDREHLHHYLIDTLGLYKANLLLFLLLIIPLFFIKFINNILLITIIILIYLLIIYIARYKK